VVRGVAAIARVCLLVPPPETVRAGKGSCFADDHRAGASCRLLLDSDGSGALTPYWSALQGLNEQLSGPGDPWLAWVRRQAAIK